MCEASPLYSRLSFKSFYLLVYSTKHIFSLVPKTVLTLCPDYMHQTFHIFSCIVKRCIKFYMSPVQDIPSILSGAWELNSPLNVTISPWTSKHLVSSPEMQTASLLNTQEHFSYHTIMPYHLGEQRGSQ